MNIFSKIYKKLSTKISTLPSFISSFFVIYVVLILLFSGLTMAANYQNPKTAYWDENFHIVAAEKYLQNSLYMEPHPPLGKLFIALGEKLTKANDCIATSIECFPANYIVATSIYRDESGNFKTQNEFELAQKCDGKCPIIIKSEGYRDIEGQIRDKSEFDLYQECLKKSDKCVSKKQYLTTDYTSLWPLNYNFVGVRLFPIVFSSFIGLLFFFLLRGITKNDHFAFLGSFLVIFDNAMTLHFRGAMLDGILMFFCLASLVCFVNIWNNRSRFFGNNLANWLVLGILVGCSYMTKVTGLFLLVFVFALIIKEFLGNKKELENATKVYEESKNKWLNLALVVGKKTGMFALGFLLIFFGVWSIHLNNTLVVDPKHPIIGDVGGKIKNWKLDLLENRVNTSFAKPQIESNLKIYQDFFCLLKEEPRNKLYFESEAKKEENLTKKSDKLYENLDCKVNGNTGALQNLFVGVKAQMLYADLYARGVPKLDVKKADENGSYPANWIVGNKTISYRWQATSIDKSGNTDFKFVAYSYLVANPVAWAVGLVGVLLSTILVFAKWIFGLEILKENQSNFVFINIFWIAWSGYMFSVLRIDRVMYLYHYFPPLVISFVLAILCFQFLFKIHKNNPVIKEQMIYFGFFVATLIFATFLFFAPFTYSTPIDCEGFRSRNSFEFWQMKSVNKIDGKDCPLYQKP